MSTAPESTDATLATATVGNAEIVGFSGDRCGNAVVMVKRDAGVSYTTDRWGNAVAIIQDDNGKTRRLDSRAVNTKFLKLGQRGWLEYRKYVLGNGYGSRWFFDPAA